MKLSVKREILPGIIIIAMVAAGVIVYPYLPEQLPIHWNLRGQVDGYVKKNVFSAFLFPFISALLWILFIVLPNFDPKKEKYTLFSKEYTTIKNTFVGLFAVLYILTIATSVGVSVNMGRVLPFIIGVVFIIIGNIMGKIRQNYFVGFKFPWTLANEGVWNRTHRLGGKLMMASGILSILGSFIRPVVGMILLVSSLGVMLAGTIGYSYYLYRKTVGLLTKNNSLYGNKRDHY